MGGGASEWREAAARTIPPQKEDEQSCLPCTCLIVLLYLLFLLHSVIWIFLTFKRTTSKVTSHVLVCLAFLSAFVFADLGTLSKGQDPGTPFQKRDGIVSNVYCKPRYTCQHQTSVKASKAACGAFDFSPPLWRY